MSNVDSTQQPTNLEEALSEIDSLRSQLSGSDLKVFSQNRELRIENQKLKEEIRQLTEQCISQTFKVRGLEKSEEKLQSQLGEAQAKIGQLEQQVSDLGGELEEFRSKELHLSQELERTVASNSEALERLLAEHSQEVEAKSVEFQSALAERQRAIEELEQRVEQFKEEFLSQELTLDTVSVGEGPGAADNGAFQLLSRKMEDLLGYPGRALVEQVFRLSGVDPDTATPAELEETFEVLQDTASQLVQDDEQEQELAAILKSAWQELGLGGSVASVVAPAETEPSAPVASESAEQTEPEVAPETEVTPEAGAPPRDAASEPEVQEEPVSESDEQTAPQESPAPQEEVAEQAPEAPEETLEETPVVGDSTEPSDGESAPVQEPSEEVAEVAPEPSAEEPSAEEPSAEQPSAEEPSAEEPSAEEPSAEEPSAEEPPAEAEQIAVTQEVPSEEAAEAQEPEAAETTEQEAPEEPATESAEPDVPVTDHAEPETAEPAQDSTTEVSGGQPEESPAEDSVEEAPGESAETAAEQASSEPETPTESDSSVAEAPVEEETESPAEAEEPAVDETPAEAQAEEAAEEPAEEATEAEAEQTEEEPSGEVSADFETAATHLEEGRHAEALPIFEVLEQNDPSEPTYKVGRLACLAGLSRFQEAYDLGKSIEEMDLGESQEVYLDSMESILIGLAGQAESELVKKECLLELLLKAAPEDQVAVYLDEADEIPVRIPREGELSLLQATHRISQDDVTEYLIDALHSLHDKPEIFSLLKTNLERYPELQPLSEFLSRLLDSPRAEALEAESDVRDLLGQGESVEDLLDETDPGEEAVVQVFLEHMVPRSGVECDIPSEQFEELLLDAEPAAFVGSLRQALRSVDYTVFFEEIEVLSYDGDEKFVLRSSPEPKPTLLFGEDLDDVPPEELRFLVLRELFSMYRRHAHLKHISAGLDDEKRVELVRACIEIFSEFESRVPENAQEELEALQSDAQTEGQSPEFRKKLEAFLRKVYLETESDSFLELGDFLYNEQLNRKWLDSISDNFGAKQTGMVVASYAICRDLLDEEDFEELEETGFGWLYAEENLSKYPELRLRLQRLWSSPLKALISEPEE